LSVWLLSANLAGSGRQIALVQVAAKVAGVALLLPAYAFDMAVGLPGGDGLREAASAAPEQAVALLYLLLQLVSALVLSVLGRPVLALAARVAPESEEERMSRPRFLYDQAVEDPETALDLVRREQARIFGFLPVLLDSVRPEAAPADNPGPLLEASRKLVGRCESFLTELLDATTSRDLMAAALQLEKRNALLGELVEAVGEQLEVPLQGSGSAAEPDRRLSALLRALVESQHALLLTAVDALEEEAANGGADDEVAVLLALSGDRSETMDALRRQVAQETRLTAVEHNTLYAATALFERMVWLVRRYSLLIARAEASAS
jgi:phosphate:Na+ symporter